MHCRHARIPRRLDVSKPLKKPRSHEARGADYAGAGVKRCEKRSDEAMDVNTGIYVTFYAVNSRTYSSEAKLSDTAVWIYIPK